MAKIPQNMQQKAEAAGESWGQFKLLDPGMYGADLEEVDATGEGPAGAYWKWVFKYHNQPGKAFLNTSFSDKAIGSVGATFRAFDAPIDTDTDELIGEAVILVIGVEKVKKGERKGQLRNVVSAVLPYEDGFEDRATGEVGSPDEYADGGDESPSPAPAAAAANGATKKAGRRRATASTAAGSAEDWQ